MRYLTCKGRGMFFLSPDAGGASGSSSGDSSSGGTVDLEKLFSDIPLDELDNKTKEAITKTRDTLKTTIANLQSKSVDDPKNKSELEKLQAESRKFQSRYDQLQAELEKVTGKKFGEGTPSEDEYLSAAQDALRKQGFSDEDVKKNAPVYANLLKSQLAVFKRDLGKDLQPMASAVAMHEAQNAFEQAQQSDKSGIMAIPEVAQKVWDTIQERAKTGQQVVPDLVLNLAKIAYVDHTTTLKSEGKEVPALQPQPISNGGVNVNTGGFSFPGASRVTSGISPIVRQGSDTKAPSAMNSDTEAAVEATFRDLYRTTGVAPKKFEEKFKASKR